MQTIQTLLEQLRQPGARIGIGIWFLPDEYLGAENSLAERLNIYPVDIRQVFLERLPKEARFSGLTRRDGYQKLLDTIRFIVTKSYPRDCVLGHTLELLLFGLDVDERQRFWQAVLEGIPYPITRLVLTLPEKASSLFPHNYYQRFSNQVASGILEKNS